MKPCPSCGATGGLSLTPVLVARPAGSYSLAGAQNKTTALEAARLTCAGGGWSATGRLEGLQVASDGTITAGHLVIDPPPTNATADPPAAGTAATSPSWRDQKHLRRYWSDALGRHVTIPDDQDQPR